MTTATVVLLCAAGLFYAVATWRREHRFAGSGDLRDDRTAFVLALVAIATAVAAVASAVALMVSVTGTG